MPFDEDQLRSSAHRRDASEDPLDVPGLVPAGDDHRDARQGRIGAGLRRRAGEEEMGQSQRVQQPQQDGEPVQEWLYDRRVQRPQELLPGADDVEPGQVEQVAQVLYRKPVLVQRRLGQAQPVGQPQDRLLRPVVGIGDDASPPVPHPPDLRQDGLNVPDVVEQVR